MRLTVAICTWNRAELLRQTLEAMTRLERPVGVVWELLVVNNNCTDATDEIVRSFDGRLPVRGISEPRAGKSFALNRAVAEAKGEYIVFTDDDVLVDPAWLAAYHRAFLRWPEAAVFGGPILPWFAGNPPEWLVRVFHQVEYAYAALDLGNAPVRFGGHNVPFGANMAIRTREQRRHLYDTNLGPRPGSGVRGEEVTMVKVLLADGGEGWWVPEARVRHHIPEARQSLAYLRGWYHGLGEYLGRTGPKYRKRVFLGRPLFSWREMVEAGLRYQWRRRFAEPEVWIEDLKAASLARGRFDWYGTKACLKRRSGNDS